MEDMLQVNNKTAEEIAFFLRDHKGENVTVIDLRGICNWTDFFIIATVSSKTHMDGIEKHFKTFCRDKEIDISGSSGKNNDDQWRLLDLGSIIIHLMTCAARDFYDLERLWAPIPKKQ
ncbi:MAG: ribosome silencing factor [Treponema sp.]|jgi:ribosome-associated protein|nr:ribosome silencing factor [Treponema sp.]